MPLIYNRIPRRDVFLGVVLADAISADTYPPAFDQELRTLLKERSQGLTPAEEEVRGHVRDILRNGRYKPTGRGKPASEYLIRRAREADDTDVPQDAFPRINAAVDCCNFISLRYLLPISLWDLDRAGSEHFVFRLGEEGESYVFNESGQPIELEDLIVGCRSEDSEDPGEPIVNPIKDSMTTKMDPGSSRVASVIYAPVQATETQRLQEACEDFAALLAGCGSEAKARYAIVAPQGEIEI